MRLSTELHKGCLVFEAEAVKKELEAIDGIKVTLSRKGIVITMHIDLAIEPTNEEILELGMLIEQVLINR